MITDQKVIERTDQDVILSDETFHNKSLTIDNLRVKEAYFFAANVQLLNGGIAQHFLGMTLHGMLQSIYLKGGDKPFSICDMDIRSNIEQLFLDNVLISNSLKYEQIKELSLKDIYSQTPLSLKNITECKDLRLKTTAIDNEISVDSISISSLLSPRGKFYIAAKSYIEFHVDKDSHLKAVDLVLDMSDGTGLDKKVLFPNKPFYFETVHIINANKVSILAGGACRDLFLQNCSEVQAENIEAANITYSYKSNVIKQGLLLFSGKVYNNLLISGNNKAIFYDLDVNTLEAIGACRVSFNGKTNCKMLQLNLDVDAYNPPDELFDDSLSLRIDNKSTSPVNIETILAKISTLHIMGKAILGDVLIQPISKIPNLFWVDSKNFDGLSIKRLVMLSDCKLCVSPDGTIRLIQTKNQLTSGNLYASINSAQIEKCAYVSVGGSIIFQGSLKIEHGDGGLASKYGDIFINGKMVAQNKLALIAEKGMVHIQNAILEANQLTIYSKKDTSFDNTVINAAEFVVTSLDGFINFKNVRFRANNMVIVAEDDIGISDSTFKTNKLYMQSNSSTSIDSSNIVAHDMFTASVRQFLLANSNIDISHYKFALFGHQFDEEHLQGGFRVAKDFQIVGVFGNGNSQHYADIKWHRVDFNKDIVPSEGRAYIDAQNGYIIGSPAEILKQQHRVHELGKFADDVFLGKSNLQEILDFKKSTSVASRISNLNVYDDFKSKELYYTHNQGDIVLDKSITKYEKLQVTASNGKILINSPNLQEIYQGSGGGIKGKQSALDARTIIGGDNVYLIADEVISEAGKFNVSGELKIITKNGVHFLPVSVHQSLMYHKGSKTFISEHEIRLVVSEINAGYLDIKAGGALNAVSALIDATGVNLDVRELNLLSEREIFEKRIVFEGKEKWLGGNQSSEDVFKDGYVIPTLIKTDKLNAKVDGATTIEAAQILVKEESTIHTKGDVNILAKYDIHVHDHKSSKSYVFNFDKGKLKVAGTKTVKEHFYGEAPVPTMYYNQGNFYGYSEGKIHLLGSKIIGDDIYLFAQKGIKLEAAPFSQEKIVTISEDCVRVGFSTGGGKHSIDAEFISQEEKTRFKNTFYDESELIARNNLVLETPDIVEIISSKMQFNKAKVKARGLHIHTHSNKTEFETTKTTLSTGLHFGIQENISSTAKTVGYVLNKTGVHWLDIVDRALNGYEAIEGGDIDFVIEEDAIIEGIKCDLDNFSLKAKNAFISTSSDTNNQETYSSNIDITVPIAGSVGGNVSTGFKKNQSESISYHDDNVVNIKGKLELNLTGDGVIRGVQFIANEVDINAKNLLVESLQDVLKARMQGMNMCFGTSNQKTSSFGVKADLGKQDKAWSNAIGSIIGRNVVNVTVQQTLEVVGGLIANAETNEDGSLTDKGEANVKAGKLIAKKLYDYDDGYSYGLGVSLSKTVDPKTGNIKYGTKVPVKYSFNEKSRDILPTIGKGNLDVDSILGGSINRDITGHTGETYSEKASLDGKLPVSDVWEVIKPKTGVNSGDTDEKVKYQDKKRKTIDVSPDSVFLKKLLSTFEQDQDSEVARMLKGMKKNEEEPKTVPIYNVSSATPIVVKPKITVGYVFNELFGIQSTQANPAIAIGAGELLMYGSGMLLGAIAGNKAVEDYQNYQLFSNYSRDYTPYSPEGSYLPALTGNPMISGLNTGLFDNPVDQMKFDGIIQEVDANLDRPTITDFATHHKPRSILFTPDSRDSLAELSRLPGFSPSMVDTWQESFPDDRSTLNDFGKLGGFTPDTWKILQEAFPDKSQEIEDFDMSILERKIELDYDKLSKEHFDDDVRYIHGKKYEGAKIRDINPDVAERMSGLIITDKSGKIRGVHNTQDHHIIHQATGGAKELFDDLGLNIHGPENRITLPSDIKLSEHEITNMTQHVGRHDGDVLKEIKQKIDKIKTPLQEGLISKEQAKSELLELIQTHRYDLETAFIMYLNKDRVELTYYKYISSNGDLDASYKLALIYLNDKTNTQNSKGFTLLHKAAEQGHLDAQYSLGVLYSMGKEVHKDYGLAFQWLKRAADKGSANAQNDLGLLFQDGLGVKRDIQEALMLFEKSAKQGCSAAFQNIGKIYLEGIGVPKNLDKAIQYFQIGASYNRVSCIQGLGTAYYLKKDFAMSHRYFKEAAVLEHHYAMYWLGNLYRKGQGVKQDFNEAIKWYKKAAEYNNAFAQFALGQAYLTGQGVKQDYNTALSYFKRAAEMHNVCALNSISQMYETGAGVVKDTQEAERWYSEAVKAGYEKVYTPQICDGDILDVIEIYSKNNEKN
ncbi:Uncharacterized protein YbeQ [Stylophora pistillata]|uniref:Uncharacterized protein YbeQ n=2 Tax=Stylophora pistillata TaxID=50429 RepID=A0A2B4R5P2_STYPI|nr:Uncharacterized protein YbeQ [Stylophora pistillata]